MDTISLENEIEKHLKSNNFTYIFNDVLYQGMSQFYKKEITVFDENNKKYIVYKIDNSNLIKIREYKSKFR